MKASYIYITGLAVAILDQIVKLIVVNHIPHGSSIQVIGALHLTSQRNTGGAFGIFSSSSVLLILVTVVVITALIVLSRKHAHLPTYVGLAFALQLGGAAGNLIDRIRLGYVVDFIDVGFWPVFNIADTAITIGILLMAYYLIIVEGREAARASNANPTTED